MFTTIEKLTGRWRAFIAMSLILSAFTLLSGCGKGSKGSNAGDQPPVFIPPDGSDPRQFELQTLRTGRLMRRIMLDMAGRLPTLSDREYVDGSLTNLLHLTTLYTLSPEFYEHFGNIHRRIWRLDHKWFPDLERFIAEGDAQLANTLTGDLRAKIANEPINNLKAHLASQRPFPELFQFSESIVSNEVADFWGMSTATLPGSFDPDLRSGTYHDNRPALGILSNQGFIASLGNDGRIDASAYALNLLRRLTCNTFHTEAAHDFSSLKENQLNNLKETKTHLAECAGCHQQIAGVQATLLPFASGTTIGSWATFNEAPIHRGHYAGHTFTGLKKLAELIGHDPRIHRCHLQGVAESILQRPLVYPFDNELLIRLVEAFYAAGMSFTEVMRVLMSSTDYRLAAIENALSSETLNAHSGVRMLTQLHWRGIINQLGFNSDLFSISEYLDPGIYDFEKKSLHHPSGPYWHATNIVARQLAKAIIDRELRNETIASSRRLLRRLPDGHAAGTAHPIVQVQIRDLYEELTGHLVTIADDPVINLTQLWSAVERGANTASRTREAWQTTILAILLSFEFISY